MGARGGANSAEVRSRRGVINITPQGGPRVLYYPYSPKQDFAGLCLMLDRGEAFLVLGGVPCRCIDVPDAFIVMANTSFLTRLISEPRAQPASANSVVA